MSKFALSERKCIYDCTGLGRFNQKLDESWTDKNYNMNII